MDKKTAQEFCQDLYTDSLNENGVLFFLKHKEREVRHIAFEWLSWLYKNEKKAPLKKKVCFSLLLSDPDDDIAMLSVDLTIRPRLQEIDGIYQRGGPLLEKWLTKEGFPIKSEFREVFLKSTIDENIILFLERKDSTLTEEEVDLLSSFRGDAVLASLIRNSKLTKTLLHRAKRLASPLVFYELLQKGVVLGQQKMDWCVITSWNSYRWVAKSILSSSQYRPSEKTIAHLKLMGQEMVSQCKKRESEWKAFQEQKKLKKYKTTISARPHVL